MGILGNLGTKPLEPKRHQELVKQLPLAAPTCHHFLAVLAALASAGVGEAASYDAGQCKKDVEDTNYAEGELGSYLIVAAMTIVLVRLWDWLRSTRKDAVREKLIKLMCADAAQEAPEPSAVSPATVAPELSAGSPATVAPEARPPAAPPPPATPLPAVRAAPPTPQQRAFRRSVASQAPTTYTAVRGCLNPRFLPLPEHSHG